MLDGEHKKMITHLHDGSLIVPQANADITLAAVELEKELTGMGFDAMKVMEALPDLLWDLQSGQVSRAVDKFMEKVYESK